MCTGNGNILEHLCFSLKGGEYRSGYTPLLGIWSVMAALLIILDVVSVSFLRGSDKYV